MKLIRLKVTTILQELDRYTADGAVVPIEEDHLLHLLMEDLKSHPLGGELPPEGRRLWQDLRVASCRGESEALTRAHQLHDWLAATYLDTPRLVIDLVSETLTLDGVMYAGFDPTALRIIKVLWDAKQSSRDGADPFVTEEQIQERVPGCRGDKTVSRHLKRLCPPIRDLIFSSSGRGRCLRLPPPHK